MFAAAPFSFLGVYGWGVLIKQISISFLVYSYIIPAVIAIVFGTSLFIRTKNISSFYLFLICLTFSIYSIFDLLAWTPTPAFGIQIFSWSILDVFCTCFFVLSYWFLYAFVKGHDLPFWQKIVTATALVPTLIITALSVNMNSYAVPTISALENFSVTKYFSWVQVVFIAIIVIFTFVEYNKTNDSIAKHKIALAGAGVFIFLFIFNAILQITNFVISINFLGLGSTQQIYSIDSYSIFGMPILLGFLGYLIAKYQAFDVKLMKSSTISLVIMVLLFVGLFFT
ncbi:MAG: hypothetical protein PHS95_03355 [Candidatus Pacebacteria bacterium]|nr:hypothetical protein [Candidatus Paceibacterota bacterium]